MATTIEEQAVEELDTLWQAALFLHGGDSGRAESLVVSTVGAAFEDDATAGGSDAGPPLERRLVRLFLDRNRERRRVQPPEGVKGDDDDEDLDMGVSRDALLYAAASVPPEPRVALWLVLVRRCSYAEAASTLGVGRDRVRELLRYRETFAAAALGRPRAEKRPRRVQE